MTPQQENITSGYAMTNSQLSNKELCSVFDGSIVTHVEAITALFFFVAVATIVAGIAELSYC